jgi:methylated-DNA-[protein]-cysteine S-methyltransferase
MELPYRKATSMNPAKQLRIVHSPIGDLAAVVENDELTILHMLGAKHAPAQIDTIEPRTSPLLKEVEKQLKAYFAKKLRVFDLPLAPAGTEFQRAAWASLCAVPHGTTWTYAEQAAHMGNPKAVRAVGAANARNPIGIIIPCHRIIGKDGSLTGYAGGIDKKQYLLHHELSFGAHFR